MRVESCGPLLGELKEGSLFYTSRLSEPISMRFSNPKENILPENEDGFLKLEGFLQTTTIVQPVDQNQNKGPDPNSPKAVERPLPVGFFLTDEEWSLYKAPIVEIVASKHLESNNNKNQSHSKFIPVMSRSTCSDGVDSCDVKSPIEEQYPESLMSLNETEGFSGSGSSGGDPFQEFRGSNKSFVGEDPEITEHDDDNFPLTAGDPSFHLQRPKSDYENESATPNYATPTDSNENEGPLSSLPMELYFMSIAGNETFCLNRGGGGNPVVETIPSHSHPISSTSFENCHQHNHFPIYAQGSGQMQPGANDAGYFEDWQSQSLFLTSEVDKARLKWKNFGEHNNDFTVPSLAAAPLQSPSHPLQQPPPNNFNDSNGNRILMAAAAAAATTMGDEDPLLVTFLSKFDGKVAALWGDEQGGREGAMYNAPPPYSASYLSTSSTPISNNPWLSPPLGQNQNPAPRFDFLAVQDKPATATGAILFQENHFGFVGKDNYPWNSSAAVASTDPIQIKPSATLVGNGGGAFEVAAETAATAPVVISYVGIRNFGPILPQTGGNNNNTRLSPRGNSIQESFRRLNHDDATSCFQRVQKNNPNLHKKSSETDADNDNDADAADAASSGAKPKPPPTFAEIELMAMQKSLDVLELEEEDEELNFEVSTILKNNPKTFIEQPLIQVDLLQSWKTHFTPVEITKKLKGFGLSSSPVSLFSVQVNPNLPEYQPFAGNEKEYNVYLQTAKDNFPIRFKLRSENENEKSVQTEIMSPYPRHDDGNEFASAIPPQYSPNLQGWNVLCRSQRERANFSNKINPNLNYNPQVGGTVFGLNNLEPPTAVYDWSQDWSVGSGSNWAELEYGTNSASTGPLTFTHSDYCCDSGIGIDGSSRAGFYDDINTDCEGDFGMDEDAGVGGGGNNYNSNSYFNNNNSYEKRPPQHFLYNNNSSSSWGTSAITNSTKSQSQSGKSGKSNRRRSKIKPCKYFLSEGFCKRRKNCKFSHDLVTCRYWAEGACLKGEMCPYLHFFVERNDFYDRAGHQHQHKHAGKRYHLESENDFPTLGGGAQFNHRSNMFQIQVPSGEYSYSSSSLEALTVAGNPGDSILMLADPAGSTAAAYDNCSHGHITNTW